MTSHLFIHFKSPHDEGDDHPFLFQRTVNDEWQPLARQLGLPLLEKTGVLILDKLEEAQQLVAELKAARRFIRSNRSALGDDREYVLERLSKVIPMIERAVSHWDEVAYISL